METSKVEQTKIIEKDLGMKKMPDYGLLFTSKSPFELKKMGKALLKTLPKTVILAIQNLDNFLAFVHGNDTLFAEVIHTNYTAKGVSFSFGIYPVKLSESQYTASVFYIHNHGFFCQLVPFDLYENSEPLTDVNGLLDKLTKKEAEAFKNYASGKKRSQIAKEMAISVFTYDNHLQSIRRKLTQSERQDLMVALQVKNDVIG